MKLELIIYVVIFIVILSILGLFIFYNWTLGNKSSDYEIVCIEGHEYYRANFLYKGFLGIHLNNDGIPIKCEVKE